MIERTSFFAFLLQSSLIYANLLCRNYLLAQAHVDAPALGSSIAHLNAGATFTPLQAIQDTDVKGFLRHAHEQNIIATIEIARQSTQKDFYAFMERKQRDNWEECKKRVFEKLGDRVGGENKAVSEFKQSKLGKGLLSVRYTHDVASS